MISEHKFSKKQYLHMNNGYLMHALAATTPDADEFQSDVQAAAGGLSQIQL